MTKFSFSRLTCFAAMCLSLLVSQASAQAYLSVDVTRSVTTSKDLTDVLAVFTAPPLGQNDVLVAYRVVLEVATEWTATPAAEGGVILNATTYFSGTSVPTENPVPIDDFVAAIPKGTIKLSGAAYPGFWDFNCTVPQLKNQYLVRARLVREVFTIGDVNTWRTELLYLDHPDCEIKVLTTRMPDIDLPPGGGGGQNGGM